MREGGKSVARMGGIRGIRRDGYIRWVGEGEY